MDRGRKGAEENGEDRRREQKTYRGKGDHNEGERDRQRQRDRETKSEKVKANTITRKLFLNKANVPSATGSLQLSTSQFFQHGGHNREIISAIFAVSFWVGRL